MQANIFSLSVDPANDGNPVTETYELYNGSLLNRSIYVSPTHVQESRDMLTLYRTEATKSGNFKGVSKSALKCTEDKAVPGVDSSTTLTAPMIGEVSFSIPVGVTAADVKHFRQRLIAILDDDTIMDKLNVQLMV